MSDQDSTPGLVVPTDHIKKGQLGRLYRKPGVEVPASENLTFDTVKELVEKGNLVPSTTTVIGARSKDALIGWAAYEAAKCSVDTLLKSPAAIVARTQQNRYRAIDYYKASFERIRDAAGERGTRVHLALECLTQDLPYDHLGLTAEENAIVDNFKKWLDEFQPNITHREVTGFGTTSLGKQSAGTVDVFMEIGGVNSVADYKCVTDETPVMLTTGATVPAIDLQEGDAVVAWSKEKGLHPSKVTFVGDNGTHPVLKISTEHGNFVTTTLNHPFWASRNRSNAHWTKAEDLQVGDELYQATGWVQAPGRAANDWAYNWYLSPYLLGMLWSLRNYKGTDWATEASLELPKVTREGTRQELHQSAFPSNKAGKIMLRHGTEKIIRKTGMSREEFLALVNTDTVPDIVFASQRNDQDAFLAGVREVFANKEFNHEEMFVALHSGKSLHSLHQFLTNLGHPSRIARDSQDRKYLRTPHPTNDMIYSYGIRASRISSIELLEPEHTVAIEVEGAHTHITGGIISHNTNKKGLGIDVSLQLAASARFDFIVPDNEVAVDAPRPDRGFGIHLNADRVTMREVDISDARWETFQYLREVWEFNAFEGTLGTFESPVGREIQTLKDL